MDVNIRLFNDVEAEEVSTIICRNLNEVNSKDYPPKIIEHLVSTFKPESILELAHHRELYVAEVDGVVVGTVSYALDTSTPEENHICFTMFVIPEFHGKGIGKMLMSFVEELASERGGKILRLPANTTALNFYKKLGYAADPTIEYNEEAGITWMYKGL
jgi:GNAT superfamily N-acetyltransferase